MLVAPASLLISSRRALARVHVGCMLGPKSAGVLQADFSTPDAFFTDLATNASLAAVFNRTIISPHVYGCGPPPGYML